MDCSICGTPAGPKTLLNCVTCARSVIELSRIDITRSLIDRDGIGKYVQAVLPGSNDKTSQQVSLQDSRGGLLVDKHECRKNIELQRTKAETAEIEERTSLIAEQAELLRDQMEEAEKQIAERKAAIAQRKSDLSSVTYGITSRRANELDKVKQNITRLEYKLDKDHRDTTKMRMYTCSTVAKLAGLKMTKRRMKDGSIKELYNIGPGDSLRIYDLRDLNEAKSDSLSASLGAVAQLLLRVSYYLGVRLPAEITAPHNDYPQATIFNVSSSYQGQKVAFPGSTPSHSSNNSPTASRHLEQGIRLPKPRPLFIDRPVTHLAAEDPSAYAFFLEGVANLAYNIAWLCRTQGLSDFNSWEDACPMGRNLYRLLIMRETQAALKSENPLDKDIAPIKPKAQLRFGEVSHATSHSFLGAANNMQYLNGWKVTPTKICDQIKAALFAEQQRQEWELLDEKELKDMQDLLAEEPIVVGGSKKRGGFDDGRSILTATTAAELAEDSNAESGREKKRGTSGWTKLKSRNEEAKKASE